MKFLLLLARVQILLIGINFSFAQTKFEKQYGEGMLVVNYDTNFVLNLYSSPNEADLVFNIVIGLDTAAENPGLTAEITPNQKAWFHPETFWNEEHIMHFVTIGYYKNWYNIIVDKQSGKSMWVLKSKNMKYFRWKDYLPNTTGIERINSKTNPIYKSIVPFKTLLSFDGQDCFKIIKVKGNWVKAYYNAEMCPMVTNYKVIPKGWFKWRDENGLLINYFLR